MKKKKWLRLIATGIMIGVCLLGTACGKGDGNSATPTQTVGKNGWQEGSVVRIGDIQVDYREAMLYLQSTKEEYEAMYGEEIWQYELAEDGSTLGEWVKDQTLEQIIYMKIICN